MALPGRVPASAQASAPTPTPSAEPTCPRCGGPMVKRIAKQGSNAGGAFLGCTAFPKCGGIKAIDERASGMIG
ncbi:MAG TPA: topoisomerase DNA-binding C4 zinc finger domain-containing protein [Accumulibacter sp.]|nr:topoisomerase DNA-binding C4 zinc finger domain-containing protein [Accumulibacter sp.]HRD94658.1 topoisomerase DNA-binding C4 zinc finger domain-containing protein [Accumulibacter sp.]HRI93716.1 topoisomerase DNA-binding C4 zinc finger domain-containing protein [Accumulibacter sp.]